MKNYKRLIFSVLFVLTLTISSIVFAETPDYTFEEEVSSLEKAEEVKQNHLNAIEEIGSTLDKCTSIKYETDIKEIVDNLNETTKESSREKDEYVKEKEEEGYTLNVEVKEHNATSTSYKFSALNGVITSTKVNNKETTEYNGKKLLDVFDSFADSDTADVRITYDKNMSSSTNAGSETKKTEEEVKTLVKELESKGYTVSYKQNSNDVLTTTITSKKALTKEDITNKLQSENTEKEVKDVVINNVTEPSTYASPEYEKKSDAENKYDELNNKGIYESIVINEKINEQKTTKISEKNKFNWINNDRTPYTEDVYTNKVKTGYKYYYAVEETIKEAQNITQTGLTEDACNALKRTYKESDGWTTSCTKVTTITKSETVNNVIKFNETKQESRTWRHLDISVNQNIRVVDAYGNTVADNIKGTLSNISVVLNEGTTNQKTISYKSPSYDNGRLEVRENTGYNGFTKVTNEDLVKLSTTIKYTYNGINVEKNIVLEGYLDNIFNVCTEKDKIGGGFDLEFDVIVDTEGNVSIVISTSETYTFTASKPAETKLQGYYDEYEYQKLYQVVAIDEDYTYNVSYVLTDYTVEYNGSSETLNVTENIYDKYYVINGSKTTYKVTTLGFLEEDDTCGTGGDAPVGKLIVNYVTTDGTKLTKSLESTELENTSYETIKKSFNGYKFVKVEGNTKGSYIANEIIEVTYIYEKLPSVNTGINESNSYASILVVSILALGALLVFRKKIFE